MKQHDLAQALARERGLSKAAARDQLDQLIHEILHSLRKGKPAEMPGIGRLIAQPPAKPSSGKPSAAKRPGPARGSRR